MQAEQIARVCHEANRAWQHVNDEPDASPEWDRAPDWQRESAVNGVRLALEGATPEELHESWALEKQRDGWVFGERKDAIAKTHPCLVPYDELPEAQRRKDALFRAIVVALS